MPDQTPILSLPLILPAQAQKHVTHNEALRLLDVLVQLVVVDRTLTVLPASPQDGARHIIATGATGEWANRDGQIAAFWDNAWLYLEPQDGWKAYIQSEAAGATFSGGEWLTDHERGTSFATVGVNATADIVNRLSVSSDATLLNHNGAGHQLKLNKANSSDTVSLLYQSGFSGQAEIGLAGNDDLSIKVSSDGTAFQEAMRIDRTNSDVMFPGQVSLGGVRFHADPTTQVSMPTAGQITFSTAGTARATLSTTALQVDVPISGQSVTQSQTDQTAGRLLKVGDFGLGAINSPDINADDPAIPSLLGRMTSGTRPDSAIWHAMHISHAPAGQSAQIAVRDSSSASTTRFAVRHRDGTGSWSSWNQLYGQKDAVGAVSQSGGQVTGALIEKGTNANGAYIRFADGTQFCWQIISVANINTPVGALFQSPAANWIFPASFTTSPNVSGAVEGSQYWLGISIPTALSAEFRALSPLSVGIASNCRLIAVGRWF
jgi:hypothetical protein